MFAARRYKQRNNEGKDDEGAEETCTKGTAAVPVWLQHKHRIHKTRPNIKTIEWRRRRCDQNTRQSFECKINLT